MKRNLSSEQQLFVSLFFFSERQGSRESSNQHDSSLFPLRSTHTHEHVGAHNVLDFNCISLGFVTYRRTQVRGLFRAPKEKEKKKQKKVGSRFQPIWPPYPTSNHITIFFFLFRSWISRPIFFFFFRQKRKRAQRHLLTKLITGGFTTKKKNRQSRGANDECHATFLSL